VLCFNDLSKVLDTIFLKKRNVVTSSKYLLLQISDCLPSAKSGLFADWFFVAQNCLHSSATQNIFWSLSPLGVLSLPHFSCTQLCKKEQFTNGVNGSECSYVQINHTCGCATLSVGKMGNSQDKFNLLHTVH
jgi:hypothetical protein